MENSSDQASFFVCKTFFQRIGKRCIAIRFIVICKLPAIAHFQVKNTRQAFADVAGSRLVLKTAVGEPGLFHMEGNHAGDI